MSATRRGGRRAPVRLRPRRITGSPGPWLAERTEAGTLRPGVGGVPAGSPSLSSARALAAGYEPANGLITLPDGARYRLGLVRGDGSMTAAIALLVALLRF